MAFKKKFSPSAPVYYFDKIDILIKLDAEVVKKLWNDLDNGRRFGNPYLKEVITSTDQFWRNGKKIYQNARRYGYETVMEICASNNIILNRLKNLHNSLVSEYKKWMEAEYKMLYKDDDFEWQNDEGSQRHPFYSIFYVELAKDCPVNDIQGSIELSETRSQNLAMRWMDSANDFFDHRGAKTINLKKAYPGSDTYYLGMIKEEKQFRHVIYSRESKVALQPCSHGEFRVRSATKVKNYLNIYDLRDLYDFNFVGTYEYLSDKYLYYYDIDVVKLGRWLLHLRSKRKKNTPGRRLKPSKSAFDTSENRNCAIQGGLYLYYHNLSNYMDLFFHFKKEVPKKDEPFKAEYSKVNLSEFKKG